MRTHENSTGDLVSDRVIQTLAVCGGKHAHKRMSPQYEIHGLYFEPHDLFQKQRKEHVVFFPKRRCTV
jgi:hypothetical protein